MVTKAIQTFEGSNLNKQKNRLNSWIRDNTNNNKIKEIINIEYKLLPPDASRLVYYHVFIVYYLKNHKTEENKNEN